MFSRRGEKRKNKAQTRVRRQAGQLFSAFIILFFLSLDLRSVPIDSDDRYAAGQ